MNETSRQLLYYQWFRAKDALSVWPMTNRTDANVTILDHWRDISPGHHEANFILYKTRLYLYDDLLTTDDENLSTNAHCRIQMLTTLMLEITCAMMRILITRLTASASISRITEAELAAFAMFRRWKLAKRHTMKMQINAIFNATRLRADYRPLGKRSTCPMSWARRICVAYRHVVIHRWKRTVSWLFDIMTFK